MSRLTGLGALAAVTLAAGALAPVAGAASTPAEAPTGAGTPPAGMRTPPAGPSTTPAGTSTTPAGTTATPTGASTTPAPRPARATLYLTDAFFVRGAAVTVPGRTVSVTGVVRPYVAGQRVFVEVRRRGRVIRRERLRVRPSAGGRSGRFTERIATRAPGLVTVRVTHAATPAMGGFSALRRYSVLDERVGPGARGRFVALIQQRLLALHVFLPQSGVYDSYTALALDAYHRLLGWGTSPGLDGRTISYLLDGFGAFKVRFPGHGDHAEGDLGHQLLALIRGAKVHWIFPISSGKSSTPTILGDFRVYSRVPGYLPDGMYFSSFFVRGYAIHGYSPAPDYPASHGCMRLPIQDAIAAYDWLRYGDWVDTYYR